PALPGQPPALLELLAVQRGVLQGLEPRQSPPGRGETPALRGGKRREHTLRSASAVPRRPVVAPVGGVRVARSVLRPVCVVVLVVIAHRAPPRSSTRSASSASVSSVSAASPEPSTASARPC